MHDNKYYDTVIDKVVCLGIQVFKQSCVDSKKEWFSGNSNKVFSEQEVISNLMCNFKQRPHSAQRYYVTMR
jgi:hypothetical protein